MAATTTPLRSSALASVTYDPDTQVMEIEFTNGRSYIHPDVPPQVVESLIGASSPGAFYNRSIKGVYG